MKPDRPRQSKYMGHVYRIKYVSEVLDSKGAQLNGETNPEGTVILIDKNQKPTVERATLIHEVCHQLLETLSSYIPDDMEENICKHLGEAMGGHIADNPLFWRYVTRRIPKEKT